MYTIALQRFSFSGHIGYYNRGEEMGTVDLPAVPMEDNLVIFNGVHWQVVEVMYRETHPQILLGVIECDDEPCDVTHPETPPTQRS